MMAATEIGAIITPPVPAFYHKPASLADAIDHMARRAIDLLGDGLGAATPEWQG